MRLLDFLRGKKEQEGDVRPFIRQYLDEHWEPLLSNWMAPGEDLLQPGALDKREMVRKDTIQIANRVGEILRENNIKVPANLANLVREESNDRIIAEARTVINEFVAGYKKPGSTWPEKMEIPLQDMAKLETRLAENSIDLGLLYYDITADKIRGMLEKYGIRRRPGFQDPEAWARNFSYSHEDIIALKAALRENNVPIQAIEHLLGNLRSLAKEALLLQQDEQFERSFLKANPDLPENPTRAQWVSAYVKTFGKDPDYLDYLQRLAGKRGTAFTGEELKNMVATALEQQHLERLRL